MAHRTPVESTTAPIPLRAGPVALHFDPVWAFARRFLVNGTEVVRAIYGAVRTDSWDTIKPRLENLVVEKKTDSFCVRFDTHCRHDESGVDFRWRGNIIGEADGTVTYDFDGEVLEAMRTNRTGLCVLHPASLAGQAVSVEHVDGVVTKGQFPLFVSPHQPFFNLRALTHQAATGLLVKVTMDGDVFEMEDQRNWTDASYKTYSTPLAIPRPHRFMAGHRVRQSVRFELLGKTPTFTSTVVGPSTLALPEAPACRLPSLGVRWASDAPELSHRQWEEMRGWKLGHLMIDADLTGPDWRAVLGGGLDAAERIGAKALLWIVFTRDFQPALLELVGELASWGDRLLGLMVTSADEICVGEATLALVRAALGRVAPAVSVAAAPAANFAELNRHRPPPEFSVAVPICPQVHAFDDESVMENIEAQTPVVQSAAQFNPHPIFVGPIVLRRQRQSDERQSTDFCAAWTVGSLAALACEKSTIALTYHEHAGKSGILGTPTSQVFAALAGAGGIAPLRMERSGRLAGIAAFFGATHRRVLLLANLTSHQVRLQIKEQPEVALGRFGFQVS